MPETPEEYERHYRPAAEAGDLVAMATLGLALLKQDRHADAEVWLSRAAEAGNVHAMTGLGVVLERRRDREQAWQWWLRAAAAGNVEAMANLGRTLGSRHPEEAERWRWRADAARRGPRTEQLPAEAVAAASTANLGGHKSTFGFDDSESGVVSSVVTVIVGLFVAAVPAGVGLFVDGGWAIACLVVAALIALSFLFVGISGRNGVSAQAYAFERGFIHRDAAGVLAVFPWAEVRVQRDITRTYVNGTYRRTSFNYNILRSDGSAFHLFSSTFPTGDVCLLGELIEQEIAAVRLPRALAALAEGKRLDFGDLTVDSHGVTGSQGTLPWRDIESVEAKDGRIRIKRAGSWLSWSRTPAGAIPDVVVLVALADALHRAAKLERQ